ncbi:MAG: VOC family protein [Bacteroidales bacterium]|nr:VOC family protein [Bacteroidales bacterium]
MNLTNSSTALFVKNINTSKEFYHNILQIPIELDFGKNIIFTGGLAIWEINSSHIIPASLGLEKITNSSVNRFELYFETENLDEVFGALKNNQVEFLHEIHEETWGQRTIRFFDPDKHLIEIGETLKQFVGRFYNQGLSLEQVSKKTHVPVEEIRRLMNV